MDEGKLWSLIRNVLSQGGAIQLDRASMSGYEEYSARLDAAASDRVAEFAKLAESALTVRDTEIARLQTDLELVRRDADRYRWLRANATQRLAVELFGQPSPTYIDSRIDAALPHDAARAGNGGEG